MVNVKLGPPGQLDSVEGVNVPAGAAAAQVAVKQETEVTLEGGNKENPKLRIKLLLTWAASHGQVLLCQHLEVLVFARGVEHSHLGLDGEEEALAYKKLNIITVITISSGLCLTIADPAALCVTPGAAGVGPEHVALGVPDHQHSGALVQDPGHQLLIQT